MSTLADLLPAPIKSTPERTVYEITDDNSSTPWLVVAEAGIFHVVNVGRDYNAYLNEAGLRDLLVGATS